MKKQFTVGFLRSKTPQLLNKFLLLIFLVLGSIQAIAQTGTVTGKVLDDKGEPIVGATIEVIDAFKKNIGGTVTDIDGMYSIEVKDVNLSSLKFSYLGNKTQTIVLKGQTSLDVKLAEDSEVLEEVVAVGYGNQTKPKVTGSISSISEKDIKLTNNATLENAMQGRSSGVQVTNNTGSPGSAASVRIRGVGSTNGGEPLYVIDGVPVSADALNLLNPNDIQSVDILKDASASAIYGTRASNGVVMITTKQGKEGKMAVSFDANYGIQNVWNKIPMLQTQDYIKLQSDLFGNTLNPAFKDPNNPYLNNNTNWQDAAFRTGVTQNYNINLSGGTDKVLYSVSGGVFDQKGILPGSDFKRYSLRVNSQIKPRKWLSFGENISMSNVQETPLNFSLEQLLKTPPILPVKNDQGEYAFSDPNLTGNYDGVNQLAYPANRDFRNSNYRILGNVYTEITLLRKIKYKLNLGLDLFNGSTRNIRSPFNIGQSPNFDVGNNPANRTISNNSVYRFSPLMDHTLFFSDTIRKNHEYSVMVGTSLQSFFSSTVNVQNDNVPQGIDITGFEGKGLQLGGRDDIFALRGYFARATYSYKNKYLLTSNVRYDGSSKFPTDKQYAVFPSMSLGWRILEEKFIKNIAFINAYVSDFKIRFGYGQTGNQEGISNNTSLQLFNDKPRDPFNPNGSAIAPANTPNRGVTWETVEQLNYGLDISLFRNKLSFVADYYIKTSKDMILQIPVLYSVGFRAEGDVNPTYWGNAGSLRNNGLELALTYRNEDKPLKYSVSGNVSFVGNRITKLASGNAPVPGQLGSNTVTETRVGSAVGEFFGYEMLGIFQSNDEATYLFGTYKPKAGDVKYRDTNGDGILDANDRVILGNNIPKIIYGFNATADFKGVDFKMFFQGVQGNKLFNQVRSSLEGMQPGGPQAGNQSESVNDRWTPENPSNDMPRATSDRAATGYNNLLSSRWIEEGSFLRIKTVQLGYTIPSALLTKLLRSKEGEVGCRVYISAFNLLTLTKYRGLDPEVGGALQSGSTGRQNEVNPLLAGVDTGTFPQARSFNLGVQFNF